MPKNLNDIAVQTDQDLAIKFGCSGEEASLRGLHIETSVKDLVSTAKVNRGLYANYHKLDDGRHMVTWCSWDQPFVHLSAEIKD